mmetsp:Transcript_56058/g.63425  ORF Transcript_56058/g.63425 Transcript_56058/m.63425 type:complete len:752 (+) Transcript_56058:55-2310(+)
MTMMTKDSRNASQDRTTTTSKSRRYSAYTIIKDILIVCILISLIVMNYLNISFIHLFADTTSSSSSNSNYNYEEYYHHPPSTRITSTTESLSSRKRVRKELSSKSSSSLSSAATTTASKFEQRKPKLYQRRRVSSSLTKEDDTSKSTTVIAMTMTTTSNNNNNSSSNYTDNDSQLILNKNDYIYNFPFEYDRAPIVVEEYKLLFFSVPKVACTTFKFLFRRMRGIKDWDNQDSQKGLPHNPQHNNLKYLWDYPLEEANSMMISNEWTKAIFVRDPKERFLSAFLDKAIANYGLFTTQVCCEKAIQCKNDNYDQSVNLEQVLVNTCITEVWDSRHDKFQTKWLEDKPCCTLFKDFNEKVTTVEGFLSNIEECPNDHWLPQHQRIEDKFWKYINFVGHLSTMKDDTEKLLKRIGAWEEFGQRGWGPYLNESIVQGLSLSSGGSISQNHATGSSTKIHQWYNPERERLVEKYYADDYKNELFDFKIVNLTQPVSGYDGKVLKRSDTIYKRDDWDGAPIVVEKYKLIFFTLPHIAATKWKQAFRRMEQLDDWKEIGGFKGLPHNPEHNDLKYLHHYPLEDAERMMTSTSWTKAIFIRSPKDRFLSIYYHMSRNREQVDNRCCPHRPGCSSALNDMIAFIELMQTCFSSHWAPFSERFDEKWWPYINFIGRIENIHIDSEKLLKKIDAWELIGEQGWGSDGNEPIFIKDDNAFASVHDALGSYSVNADELLNAYYKADYENEYLNFTSKKVYVMEH